MVSVQTATSPRGETESGVGADIRTGLSQLGSCDSVSLAFHRNPSKDVDMCGDCFRGMGFVNRLENAKDTLSRRQPTLRLTEGQSRHF